MPPRWPILVKTPRDASGGPLSAVSIVCFEGRRAGHEKNICLGVMQH